MNRFRSPFFDVENFKNRIQHENRQGWEAEIMKTRRDFMTCAAAGPFVFNSTGENTKPQVVCFMEQASKLAETMEKCSGGQWLVSVDERLEFILVRKVLA